MIYLDHAASAPLCNAAKKVIIEHLDDYGNPSSVHEFGRRVRVLIENAREKIARCINADPDEIYFCSGGSEANTWALHMKRSIATSFEHHSIKPTWNFISPDRNGLIGPKSFDITGCPGESAINLASCMYVNNELGTIQPVSDIAHVVHSKKDRLFHTDAVQALPYIPIDVKQIDCDMLSASGHKCGALKGIGFLYVKNGTNLLPLINGGSQEDGKRPGTENVLGILSMAAALEDAVKHMEERNKHIKRLRDNLLEKLLEIPGSHLNGSLENRVVSNINIRFDGVSGSRLVALCSIYGVYLSSGSACNEGVNTPSHALKAIGLTDEEALSSIRITIGHVNTEEEINMAATIIKNLVNRIRESD